MTASVLRPSQHGRRRAVRSVALFLLPALVLYVLFVLVLVGQAAFYSLFRWNGIQPLTDFVGLRNYETALGSSVFLTSLGNNLLIVGLSLLVQIPFSLA